MMQSEQASQGKVTGVIIPPPDIRAVVDKTAGFVARNGKSFEQRILASGEGKTAKFNFMKPFDPYHAYYEQKIQEFEEGGNVASVSKVSKVEAHPSSTVGSEEKKGDDDTSESKKESKNSSAIEQQGKVSLLAAKASITNPIARISKQKITETPIKFEFSITHPTAGVSAMDIDVIKLTAQYTAVNGKEFLTGLAQREQRNIQFDFLRPTHMLFSYFTSLVGLYSKLLAPSAEMITRLDALSDPQRALESAVQRWEWTRSEAERKRRESNDALLGAEGGSAAGAAQHIDWFDFTVVETIEFPEDECFSIPGMEALGMVGAVAEDRMGNDNRNNRQNSINSEAMELVADDDDDDDEAELNVVMNYVHAASSSNNSTSSGTATGKRVMIDPISGREVPEDQMEEHMRVQLLDPKWREQKKRFLEKQKETGYADSGSIAANLQQFARKRGDIFGQAAVGSGPNSAAAIALAEDAKRIKSEIQSSVQWDGHSGSIPATQSLRADVASRASGLIAAVNAATALPTRPVAGPAMTAGAATGPPPAVAPPHMYVPAAPMPMPIPSAQRPAFVPHLTSATAGLLPPPPPPMIPTPAPVVVAAVPAVSAGVLPPPPPPVMLSSLAAVAAAPPPPPPPGPPSVPSLTHQVSVPPPAPPAGADGVIEQPQAKKARSDASLVPEVPPIAIISADEFAAAHPGPVSVQISLPPSIVSKSGSSSLTFNDRPILSTIKQLKELAAAELQGVTVGKLQLKHSVLGFLKDANTLAVGNLTNSSVLELSIKERGGKK